MPRSGIALGDDTTAYIEFAYSEVTVSRKKVRRETKAKIEIVNAQGQTLAQAEGASQCSEKDNFCKATGRLYSLRKAIENGRTVLNPKHRNIIVEKVLIPESHKSKMQRRQQFRVPR